MAETYDRQPAVVLLSGGLDSATTLAIARDQGRVCHALSFDYGQRHRFELEAASAVARALGAAVHRVVSLDLAGFGGSALTDVAVQVPKDRSDASMARGIPATYVPARNTILLAMALGYAETVGSCDLYIGVNAVDFSGYPDCRPAFIDAFERMANLGTRMGVEGARIRVHAPLIALTKGQIIRRGLELGVDYGLTHSCYDPQMSGAPCGRCDACQLRAKGFAEAGVEDPALRRAPR